MPTIDRDDGENSCLQCIDPGGSCKFSERIERDPDPLCRSASRRLWLNKITGAIAAENAGHHRPHSGHNRNRSRPNVAQDVRFRKLRSEIIGGVRVLGWRCRLRSQIAYPK